MEELKTLFISYSWKDCYFADRICDDLNIPNLKIVRDTRDMNYGDSIPDFMKRIRKEDYVLLLISDNYLKALNCMKEIVELKKDDYRWNALCPIVLPDVDIYSEKRLEYVVYWQNKIEERKKGVKEIEPDTHPGEYEEYKKDKAVADNISDFLLNMKTHLLCSVDELWCTNYKCVLDKIGIPAQKVDNRFKMRELSTNELDCELKKNVRCLCEGEGTYADLSYCYLHGKVLVGKDYNLSGINFQYSNLSSAYLKGADLSGCNLRWANLKGANMDLVNLCGADLSGADLTGIHYDKARVSGATFSYAIMDEKFKDYVLKHGGIINNE